MSDTETSVEDDDVKTIDSVESDAESLKGSEKSNTTFHVPPPVNVDDSLRIFLDFPDAENNENNKSNHDNAKLENLRDHENFRSHKLIREPPDDVIYAENENFTVGPLVSPIESPVEKQVEDVHEPLSSKPEETVLYTKSDPLGKKDIKSPQNVWLKSINQIKSMNDYDAVEYVNLEGLIKGSGNDTEDKYTEIKVPTLRECMKNFTNTELERRQEFYSSYVGTFIHHWATTFYDILAAFYVYLIHTFNSEAVVTIANAALVTMYFCLNSSRYAVKLDFSILAFAVVFPLSFLIQQAYTRRERALLLISDFRALVVQTVLASFMWDWPKTNDPLNYSGRTDLPDDFNKMVRRDSLELFKSVYSYLSMPTVTHARHQVFPVKREETRSVHAQQNDIIKSINDILFRFNCHSEIMKSRGFPAGEASRLHQYHWFLQQRFEELRYIKYYRTPQATRSFGRVYVLILPWLAGPYFAWVNESAGATFTISLSAVSFLILLGLLNTQKYLEDPFVEIDNGLDHVKLKYEFASAVQTVEQHFAYAEMKKNTTKWNDASIASSLLNSGL